MPPAAEDVPLAADPVFGPPARRSWCTARVLEGSRIHQLWLVPGSAVLRSLRLVHSHFVRSGFVGAGRCSRRLLGSGDARSRLLSLLGNQLSEGACPDSAPLRPVSGRGARGGVS